MSFSIPSAESWQDFSLSYVPAVDALKSGFLPYRDFFYPYPPLFLYALTVFSYLPLPSWSSALPLVIGDAMTVVPLYLIARELGGERAALLASLVFVASPLNLYYVDYLWLNPSLTTLFLMTSVYLLIKRLYGLSAAALALSFGFKQTALVALPVIVLVLGMKRSKAVALRYFAYSAAGCILVSIPFIALSPANYLDSVFMVPSSLWVTQNLPSNYFSLAVGSGTPVSFNTSVWLTSKWQSIVGPINAPVSLALPVFIFFIPSSLAWRYSSDWVNLSYYVLLVSYALVLYRIRKNRGIESTDILMYLLFAFVVFFTIYPLYKYYVVGVVPLLALMVRNRRGIAGFAVLGFAFMIAPRYLGSWVLLGLLLWLLAGRTRWMLKGFGSRRQSSNDPPSRRS